MESTEQIIAALAPNYSQSSIGAEAKKPIVDRTIVREVDRALELTADLMTDQNYKKWFATQAYRLGADRYLGIASDARTGKQPDRLFVYLLRRV